jgi:hypothetical protein
MKSIYLGNSALKDHTHNAKGDFVKIENESFYCIHDYQEMPDFFVSVVSDSDHFMFISSNGSLTAGRKDRDNALFPYYTDDKIHDYRGLTGSKTVIRVEKKEKVYLWEPFTENSENVYGARRNLYKSIYGNKILFEEINSVLGIKFRYGWYNSDKFGFVKKSLITNISEESLKIDILDGLRNILPHGIEYPFQNEFSNLSDAYKKNERIEGSSLGLFMLSSVPVDRAEPSEALKTTTVWSHGPVEDIHYLISDRQLEDFKYGRDVRSENDIRAKRGAYYLNCSLQLKENESKDWIFVAEINQDSREVNNLLNFLRTGEDIKTQVYQDIEKGTRNLIEIVALSDGLQKTNEELGTARHFSNTLFNLMRGGIYANGYLVEIKDFIQFARNANKPVYEESTSWFASLKDNIAHPELVSLAEKSGNADLVRIAMEYLPLTFSRRHGDPSRPWNRFSIETRNPDGSKKLNYEGNWRDIFQNWEALNLSFPGYIESTIAKFLNASTPDGYNPYRITRNGIDWEVPDPKDPWAYIGYWGDHQVIYLQKFLEQSEAFYPGTIQKLLDQEIFVYANVPYRIKSYDEIVKDPQNTVLFDHKLNADIKMSVSETGADGRLLMDSRNHPYRVNLTEKILLNALTKLSNFVPEAGIWMNTQRPEWNDANNALVGSGVSMVTLYYLRRYLNFWEGIFSSTEKIEISISEELVELFKDVFQLFSDHIELTERGFSNKERESITRGLGMAGTNYRETIYTKSFSGKKLKVPVADLAEFSRIAIKFLDQSIRANKREDGLYHAYNLISFKKNEIIIRHLYEMLEGQVAVLSSGYLSVEESLEVMEALKKSKLFREDQYSYLLYPDRQLPGFMEKNNIKPEKAEKSKLLKTLLEENDTSVILKDNTGGLHFNGSFRNKNFLADALDQMDDEKYGSLVRQEKQMILDIYEEMFDHQSFTGRSGTFYGYEGLGSIYWHMVSKLLLAVEECYFRGMKESIDMKVISKIKDHYYEIKAGIGLYKSPDLYGAFPTDAYSHSPGGAGVKQPGLTGQVKEDVITRMAELGVQLENGQIIFDTSLLNENEFLEEKAVFEFYNLKGNREKIELEKDQLAFTFCQVPVVYKKSKTQKLIVEFTNGERLNIEGNGPGKEISSEIFNRTGKINKMEFLIGIRY